MPKALEQQHQAQESAQTSTGQKLDWRRKISDHVAFGLLVYTGLHIFGTMTQLKTGNGSMLPYLALVILVAAIIPACRWFEMRWEGLSEEQATDPALAPAFKREVTLMWAAVVGLPVVLTLGFKGLSALF
ncbi:hypothetical protein OZN62_10535 [Aurantiacibacter sp. MUD11]|uniref:hypothetical protein n=1 Tax=Aurantiacibacter sp. MUD11 TaxID=3003265 RepID=UPI0022AA27E9|nr:hypothetical protein [Aurantiacibacter sp. MUD11]WAT17358.1 hypothetical protein OZN62_10535 [Aurantiacibacter sp. MUD11]